MRSVIAVAAVTLLLAGCGQDVYAPTATLAVASSDTTAALLARPLRLPAVAPGAACPVTPVASVSTGVGNPRGRGPFYLGGGMPQGAFAWNKTVYIVTGTPDPSPILLRGARIDGVGRLQFTGDPVASSDAGVLLSSGGGVTDRFYDRALQKGGGGALYVFPSTKGCYAIQVDAQAFQDVIVVSAG